MNIYKILGINYNELTYGQVAKICSIVGDHGIIIEPLLSTDYHYGGYIVPDINSNYDLYYDVDDEDRGNLAAYAYSNFMMDSISEHNTSLIYADTIIQYLPMIQYINQVEFDFNPKHTKVFFDYNMSSHLTINADDPSLTIMITLVMKPREYHDIISWDIISNLHHSFPQKPEVEIIPPIIYYSVEEEEDDDEEYMYDEYDGEDEEYEFEYEELD